MPAVLCCHTVEMNRTRLLHVPALALTLYICCVPLTQLKGRGLERLCVCACACVCKIVYIQHHKSFLKPLDIRASVQVIRFSTTNCKYWCDPPALSQGYQLAFLVPLHRNEFSL